MMKYCEYCAQFKPDAPGMFCMKCGSPLLDRPAPGEPVNAAPNAYTQPASNCPSCGRPVPAGRKFCTGCGAQLASPAQPQAYPQTPPSPQAHPQTAPVPQKEKGGKKTLAVVLAVLAGLVLITGGVIAAKYIMDRNETTQSEDEDESTTKKKRGNSGSETSAGDETTKKTVPSDETAEATTDFTREETTYALTPAPAEEETTEDYYPAPRILSASTLIGEVLPASNVSADRTFDADQAIDGRRETCWCVSTDRGGEGARIEFFFTQKTRVSGITILNGNLYKPEESIYSKNGQVASFTLYFSSGEVMTFTAYYNNGDPYGTQTIPLTYPVIAESVVLEVNNVYTGSKFTTNVCLGEFGVY